MKKEFNITGTCYPDKHYMMDNSQKLEKVLALIKQGKYFTINRPRQFGKTTTMLQLSDVLLNSADYIPIELNFQGIDSKWYESDELFAQMFLNEVKKALRFSHSALVEFLDEKYPPVGDMNTLSTIISELIRKASRKVVVFIDEVDASSNYASFINFLGMLRTKYLAQSRPQHATFHSIVLSGVHDLKYLKYKLRNPDDAQFNSPWNIAIDFNVDMSFNPKEIAPMLQQYASEENKTMDIPAIAQRLHYHTAGYPFLISRLCKIIAEDLLPERGNQKNWTIDDVEDSVQVLLKENNTNFDSLIKNLENNDDLYDLVYRIIMEGETVPFNQYNPVIYLGVMYGVFKRNGQLKIHNRIYEQLIYEYLASKTLTDIKKGFNYAGHFTTNNNGLDMRAVLLKFQQFMKEQYTQKDWDFYERQGRLIFLAFLSPILNGKGHSFREVQASLEKRLDVIVHYFQHKYIIELKRWYGPEHHQKGLDQLVDYLNIHSVEKGFLLIFDSRKKRTWDSKTVQHKGKEIFAVWV